MGNLNKFLLKKMDSAYNKHTTQRDGTLIANW